MSIRIAKTGKSLCFAALLGAVLVSPTIHAQDQPAKSNTLTETTKEFLSDPARTGSLVGSILAGAAIANPLAPILGSVAGFLIGKQTPYSRKKTSNSTAVRLAHTNRTLVADENTQTLNLSGDAPAGLVSPTQMVSAPGTPLGELSVTIPRESAPENLDQSLPLEQSGTLLLTEESQAGYPRLREDKPFTHPPSYPFPKPAAAMPIQRPLAPTMGIEANVAGQIGGSRETLLRRLANTCSNVQLSTQPVSKACYYFSQ